MRTLFRCKFGSHLYGTFTPESDTDYKSIHIPAAKDIIMQQVRPVVVNSTGNPDVKNNADDIDDESFALGKFFNMIQSGDMIAYELLFVKPEQSELFSLVWRELIHNEKYKLIDKNINGFLGYIRKQVNKYGVKGSRIATARAAVELFTDLKNRGLKRVGDACYDEYDEFVCLNEHSKLLELPINKNQPDYLVPFIEILNRKIDFRVSINEALNITQKIFNEYGSRALAAESNEGVDWKAVYHAVRVSEQALELINTGDMTFPRPNVASLMKIRRGERSFKDVAEELENNLDQLEAKILDPNSILRDKVDVSYMDSIKEKLYLDSVRKYYE